MRTCNVPSWSSLPSTLLHLGHLTACIAPPTKPKTKAELSKKKAQRLSKLYRYFPSKKDRCRLPLIHLLIRLQTKIETLKLVRERVFIPRNLKTVNKNFIKHSETCDGDHVERFTKNNKRQHISLKTQNIFFTISEKSLVLFITNATILPRE